MDNFNILIIIIIFALIYIKQITKFLLNIKQIILKKKLPKDFNVTFLIIITVLLFLYFAMDKKNEFCQKKRSKGKSTSFYGWAKKNGVPDWFNDYIEGSTSEPIEHEHPITEEGHNHKGTSGANKIRHTHIMTPPPTESPMDEVS